MAESGAKLTRRRLRPIAGGSTISAAMMKAGYSPAQAKKGRAGLPEAVKVELRRRLGERWAELVRTGKQLQDPEELRHGLVGALVSNVANGQDRAPQSLKMLGQLRGVEAFTPENQTGLIIVELPQGVRDHTGAMVSAQEPVIIEAAEPMKLLDDGTEKDGE